MTGRTLDDLRHEIDVFTVAMTTPWHEITAEQERTVRESALLEVIGKSLDVRGSLLALRRWLG